MPSALLVSTFNLADFFRTICFCLLFNYLIIKSVSPHNFSLPNKSREKCNFFFKYSIIRSLLCQLLCPAKQILSLERLNLFAIFQSFDCTSLSVKCERKYNFAVLTTVSSFEYDYCCFPEWEMLWQERKKPVYANVTAPICSLASIQQEIKICSNSANSHHVEDRETGEQSTFISYWDGKFRSR